MRSRDAQDIGSGVGVLGGIVLLILGVLFSYSHWDSMIQSQRHRKDWRVHQAVVTSVSEPDFSNSPPDRATGLKFSDYYGQPVTAQIHMPYGTRLGDAVNVDVGRDGSLYVPSSTDQANQTYDDPFKAINDFWPSGGIIFIAIPAGLIGGLLIGVLATTLANAVIDAKALRAHKKASRLWSAEKLAKAEREVYKD